MVEGAALEMLYRGNSIVGSNPTLSAIFMLRFRDPSPFSSVSSPPAPFIGPFPADGNLAVLHCALTPVRTWFLFTER